MTKDFLGRDDSGAAHRWRNLLDCEDAYRVCDGELAMNVEPAASDAPLCSGCRRAK